MAQLRPLMWLVLIGTFGALFGSTSANAGTAPPNDNFADAIVISSLPFSDTQDTVSATPEAADPAVSCGANANPRQANSVWYTYAPSSTSAVDITTEGSSYDTVLAVFAGPTPLTEIACNDDEFEFRGSSRVSGVTLQAGTSYHIEVTARFLGPGGSLLINVTPAGVDPDSDLDGCTDEREEGDNPALGGLRDPDNFWDFFDTPDAGNARDHLVSAADLARVVSRFGGSGDKTANPLSTPPPAPAYHPAFDRTPPGTAPNSIDQSANGNVSAQDIAVAVTQFGHTCA